MRDDTKTRAGVAQIKQPVTPAARASRGATASDASCGIVVVAPRGGARIAGLLEADGHVVETRRSVPTGSAESLDGPGWPTIVLAPSSRHEHDALVADVTDLRSALPECRLVVVVPTVTVRETRALFASGMDALVLEREAERFLSAAVAAVTAGLLVLPHSLRELVSRPALSAREKQVLGMVVLGLTNREIADRLSVSESTVKSHLARSFRKIGAKSRREAAALILDPTNGLGTGILAISEDA